MKRLYTSGCGSEDPLLFEQCSALVEYCSFAASRFFCALLLVCVCLNHVVFSHNHLRKLYGSKYVALSHGEQRRARLLHVGIAMKMLTFFSMSIALYQVVFLGYRLTQSWIAGTKIWYLVLLAVSSFASLSLFELINDENTRPIYVLHHLSTLAVFEITPAVIMGLRVERMTEKAQVAHIIHSVVMMAMWS